MSSSFNIPNNNSRNISFRTYPLNNNSTDYSNFFSNIFNTQTNSNRNRRSRRINRIINNAITDISLNDISGVKIFKKSNLLEWFKRNLNCPICRYNIDSSTTDMSNNTSNNIRQITNNIFNAFSQDMSNNIVFEYDIYTFPINNSVISSSRINNQLSSEPTTRSSEPTTRSIGVNTDLVFDISFANLTR
jgi:hypothetical protein